MQYKIFADSGAPFLYHQFARAKKPGRQMGAHIKDRKNDTYDWLDDPKYLDYREAYARFLKKHEHETEVYSNLDIVNNPEATWENQQWFEERGFHPLPIWHFGSDVKWLVHYIERGYDYIGIGGMVPNPYNVLRPALDDIFANYICKNGTPIVKTHGFAAASIPLMVRYPWYSIDSSTWIKTAAFGQIIVPRKIRGEYCYRTQPHKIEVSLKSPKLKNGGHFDNSKRPVQQYIREYVEEQGFEFGESKLDDDGNEIIIKAGIRNDYKLRCNLNLRFYVGLQNSLPEWPWRFIAAEPRKSLW